MSKVFQQEPEGHQQVQYLNTAQLPMLEKLQISFQTMNLFRRTSSRMMNSLVEPLSELEIDDTERCLMLAVIIFSEGLF